MLNTKKRKGCLNLQHTKAGGSQKHILQISLSLSKKKRQIHGTDFYLGVLNEIYVEK